MPIPRLLRVLGSLLALSCLHAALLTPPAGNMPGRMVGTVQDFRMAASFLACSAVAPPPQPFVPDLQAPTSRACWRTACSKGQISSRRDALRSALVLTLSVALSGSNTAVEAAIPTGRALEWSFLWGAEVSSQDPPKRKGASAVELAEVLSEDLGHRKYILTGDLSPAIFADDCRFVDPNNAVNGLAKYRQALSYLFDPEESQIRSVSVHATSPDTIEAEYVASGVIKLPWRPRIAPWAGHITYTVREGLIVSQVDVWNITRLDALRQTFTPS